MDCETIFKILRILFTISFPISTFFMIKKEKARTDIDAGITYRNGTSECKGENIMMLIMLCIGMIMLLWSV